MTITYWNGEVIERMTKERASVIRKEVVKWANNYEAVTGSADLGRQAKEFIKTFDEVRKS